MAPIAGRFPVTRLRERTYQIRITSITNAAYTDTSNANFTITGPPPPTITVVTPNGGRETGQQDQRRQSPGHTQGTRAVQIKIELLNAGSPSIPYYAVVGSGGNGSYNLIIPANQVAGINYRIRITSITNAAYTDTSDADFTITGPPPPTITVVTPNGGENWAAGSTQTITWTYTGNPGSAVKIDLYQAGLFSTNIIPSTGYWSPEAMAPIAWAIVRVV